MTSGPAVEEAVPASAAGGGPAPHINTANPVPPADSAEPATVEASGREFARDGMEREP